VSAAYSVIPIESPESRNAIRIVIADGHRLMIHGIRRAFEASGQIDVVGEARSGAELLPVVRETSPDLVLVDVHIPDLDGFGCLDRLRRQHPDVKVILFASAWNIDELQRARGCGASGYLLKTVDAAALADAIEQAVDGSGWPTSDEANPREELELPAREAGLTEREIEILRDVARGDSSKVIAHGHGVSEQAIKFHLTNIYRKLGVANRTQAARCAYQLGLVHVSLLETA
jgi:two-component system, NarL family, response regulator LiaR